MFAKRNKKFSRHNAQIQCFGAIVFLQKCMKQTRMTSSISSKAQKNHGEENKQGNLKSNC